jgi:hypothetical protein
VNLARAANGDRGRIADASRAFVRMVWHIFMAIIAIAGVRAKIKGLSAEAAAAAESTGAAGGTAGAAGRGGGEVVDIASHPGFRPAGPPAATTGPTASAFEGGAARQLAPEPVPVKPPVAPPEPVPSLAPSPSALARGVKPARVTAGATGAAAGVELARSKQEEEESKRHPTMRHQIQRGDDHLSSVAVAAANRDRGVTARELRQCMADNFARYMALAGQPGQPRRPVEYERPIRSGIIWQSQQLPGIVAAGGISQGGDINSLRWCFGDRSLAEVPCGGRDIGEERVRLDVENNGRNLRFLQ